MFPRRSNTTDPSTAATSGPARPDLGLWAGGGAAVAALFVLWSLWRWSPGGLFGDGSVIWTAVAVVAGIWGVLQVRATAAAARARTRRRVLGAAAAVALLTVVGSLTQTTVAGRPVLQGSQRDQAVRDVTSMRDALDELVAADELLALPLDQARVRSDELTQQGVELEKLVAGWGQRDESSFANPSLLETARALVQAADAGRAALQDVADNAVQFDQGRADRAATLRSQLVSEALRAGQLLKVGATDAGVAEVLDAPVRE